MYCDFAYTRQMQLILIAATFAITFFSMYLLSNVILSIFGLSANRKQKSLFAFINGTLGLNLFVFAVYFSFDMASFSPLIYHLVISPNPLSAIVYYATAKHIFKLSSVRSVKLMSYVILFISTALVLNRLTGSLFFLQNEAAYNYLKDTLQQVTHFGVILLIYFLLQYYFKRKRSGLEFADNMFIHQNREFTLYIARVSFVYLISILTPVFIAEQVIAYAVNLLLVLFFIVINICMDIIAYYKQSISNRDVHISALFQGLEELRGIKHDFNNVLHNYGGYLALKEYEMLEKYHASLVTASSHVGIMAELKKNMPENPTLIALLIKNLEFAERKNVRLFISLTRNLDHLYINHMDALQILSDLLKNAIEAAGSSRERKVYFNIESKTEKSKLIIITHSTPASTRQNEGILSAVQKVIAKYGNCSFQMNTLSNELSVYVELKDLE